MTVGEWLPKSTQTLRQAGIDTARLDALVLLEDVLNTGRASLLAHPELALSAAQIAQLNKFITQRIGHTPLAYLRGQAPFYGRNFYVSPAVLIPRPETEAIITQLLASAPTLPSAPHILDVGTGSGCIGITARLELPEAVVTLIDIDDLVLDVARRNAAAHHVTVDFHRGDLLRDVKGRVDVILTNLPYVPRAYPINKAASHEPALALFSGQDGLDAYRTFWKQAGALIHRPAHIIVESLPQQMPALREMASAQGYKVAHTYTDDFVQHFVTL